MQYSPVQLLLQEKHARDAGDDLINSEFLLRHTGVTMVFLLGLVLFMNYNYTCALLTSDRSCWAQLETLEMPLT